MKGTKLLADEGDIIFGKRRAYQKKVGISPFACICSAHALVIRENSTRVNPGFLPWFMLSDVFTTRAISISEGSLSPTIKWRTLADQEFMIPNLEDQGRITQILNSTHTFSQSLSKQIDHTREIQAALLTVCGEQ